MELSQFHVTAAGLYQVQIIILKRPWSDIWCPCFHYFCSLTHTRTHTPQLTTHLSPHKCNRNSTVFVGGPGCYLTSPSTPAYSTVFACFSTRLQCKALQGEINFNQSRFPAASGKRVYTSQFWWTRTRLFTPKSHSQVLRPWIVASCHLSIKGGNVHTHAAYHFSWGMRWAKWIINELILQAVAHKFALTQWMYTVTLFECVCYFMCMQFI